MKSISFSLNMNIKSSKRSSFFFFRERKLLPFREEMKIFPVVGDILLQCKDAFSLSLSLSRGHSSSCSRHRNRSRRAVVVDYSHPSRSSSKNSGIVINNNIVINQREGEAFWRQNTKTNRPKRLPLRHHHQRKRQKR